MVGIVGVVVVAQHGDAPPRQIVGDDGEGLMSENFLIPVLEPTATDEYHGGELDLRMASDGSRRQGRHGERASEDHSAVGGGDADLVLGIRERWNGGLWTGERENGVARVETDGVAQPLTDMTAESGVERIPDDGEGERNGLATETQGVSPERPCGGHDGFRRLHGAVEHRAYAIGGVGEGEVEGNIYFRRYGEPPTSDEGVGGGLSMGCEDGSEEGKNQGDFF